MGTLLFAIVLGACCGIIGSVYRFILAYEKPFTNWWKFGARFEGKWFFRPVWGCAKCFAGQLSAWFWLATAIIPRILSHYRQSGGIFRFSCNTTQTVGVIILGLISAISVAIATAVILGPILENKNER